MIIAYYSKNVSIDTKFIRFYEGQIVTALYLDGSKRSVKIIDGKPYKA